MIRNPAVAGAFYPLDEHELRRVVDTFVAMADRAATPATAIACIVPHAGYIYSGQVAGEVYAAVRIPKRLILIGPRHYPEGRRMAMISEGAFLTPLGQVRIDQQLARSLARECPLLGEDRIAHEREHSLEVQLPFLQRARPDFTFVPIVLASEQFTALEEFGKAMAQVIASAAEPILIVTSTDMNHYESDAATRVKDARAIACIEALDARGLHDTAREEKITMCGSDATVAMLVAARELGAGRAQLIRYATSAEVNGDYSRAVGYAGFVIQ